MGLIYIARSKRSHKMYVGQTIYTLKDRLRSHFYRGQESFFTRALLKYGTDGFDFITIENVPNELLDSWERFFIKELSTLAPLGYNLTEGGNGCAGGHLTEEHRRNLSIANRGRKYPTEMLWIWSKAQKGKHLSEDHKRKISIALMGHPVSDNSNKAFAINCHYWLGRKGANSGKTFSQEARHNMSEAAKRRVKK